MENEPTTGKQSVIDWRQRGRQARLLVLAVLMLLTGLWLGRALLSASPVPGIGCLATLAAPLYPAPGAPPLYLGLAAYRQLDKLAYLEIGDRVLGQSTADLYGLNADASHYLRTLPSGGRVLFDATGPGLVTFMRMQESYGAPWTLNSDGQSLTVTAGDLGQKQPSDETAQRFPYPLSLNPAEDQGSSIIALPLAFGQRLTWSASQRNGNFYALYRRLPYGLLTSGAGALCRAGDRAAVNSAASLLSGSTADGEGAAALLPDTLTYESGQLTLPRQQVTQLITVSGPRQIRLLSFRVPFNEQVAFGNSWLQIYWDGERSPSVSAPLKFLVGDGAGVYQPQGRPLVAGWLAGAHGDGHSYLEFDLFWPMPFHQSARIMLLAPETLRGISWRLGYEPFPDPPNWWGTFHATYTSITHPPQGTDLTLLDVRGSGKLVGTIINFWRPDGTLEGNPSIFIDDSRTPQIEVTGTEEWGLGGDYWHGGQQTTLPLGGLPSSQNNPRGSDHDGAALYRFLVADSIAFNRHLLVRWGHGSVDQSTYPYRATLLWYGTPQQTALLDDTLQPSSPAGRLAHAYQADGEHLYLLQAGDIYQRDGPPASGLVSATTGAISFTLQLNPHNVGAFLRRTFDYCVANQSAAVYVNGAFAGTWYSAGAATAPPAPPGTPARCWRQEDFPLPASLTMGQSTITVRLVPTSLGDAPSPAWTAFSYQAYSFVL
jgi:hypothetical protein